MLHISQAAGITHDWQLVRLLKLISQIHWFEEFNTNPTVQFKQVRLFVQLVHYTKVVLHSTHYFPVMLPDVYTFDR